MNIPRNKVVQRLLNIFPSPCPGLCGNKPTEFHHYPWRDGQCYTPEAKVQAYHEYNGVLTCHACHQMEGYAFQTRCAVMVLSRAGDVKSWFEWAAPVEMIASDLPHTFNRVVWAWAGKRLECPFCGTPTVLSKLGICTECYKNVRAQQ